ncbi:hypothetical protein [uncultured Tyzzerella sp.]|uniref:hypothetical protein n=1 Tax=uncultured Tyzzerella sp. TaxID=2321398 RepID=UPI0029437F4A|nr:hypothetical protein [uncultured Tyzzerella sp.]
MRILKRKLNDKMLKTVAFGQAIMMRLVNKLNEENGADGSTEKGGWIIIALILVGLAITFINKFFPEFFNMIGDKLKEMFNLIKTS